MSRAARRRGRAGMVELDGWPAQLSCTHFVTHPGRTSSCVAFSSLPLSSYGDFFHHPRPEAKFSLFFAGGNTLRLF